MLAPLAVCTGLNVPQAPVGPQLQLTPLLAESFVTVAAMTAVAPVFNDPGGAVDSVTEIAVGDVMFTTALAFFVLSETELAVMVTLTPAGTDAGAV